MSLALAPAALRAQDELPRFELDSCPFEAPAGEVEGETIACGYLYVQEDRGDPLSAPIQLAVAIIFSSSPDPHPDPIVYLEGGPGGGALSGLADWLATPYIDTRDFILVDQRGTGYSQPSLNCPEIEEAGDGDPDAQQVCHDRLVDEGVTLAAYNSAASAADLNDLRMALGIEEWNVYGISYGTRLALTVMRDYPDGLRSVILDSVYPPHVNAYEEHAANGARAFRRLFADCAADSACSAAYPDLENVFYQLVERLNAEPEWYTVEDAETGELVDIEVYGDDLVDALFDSLYLNEVIAYVPLAIYTASKGDYEEAFALFDGVSAQQLSLYFDQADLELLRQVFSADELALVITWANDETLSGDEFFTLIEDTFTEEQVSVFYEVLDIAPEDIPGPEDDEADYFDSEGMFNSVSCVEELPFNSLVVAEFAAIPVPAAIRGRLLDDAHLLFDVCRIWDVAAADSRENEPVVSDIPALVLSGSYDPITPSEWAQEAAAHLSSSFYYDFPGYGHSVSTSGECAQSIALAFLDDPAAEPDSSCLSESRAFFIPGD